MLSRTTLFATNAAFFLGGIGIVVLSVWSATRKEGSSIWDDKFGHVIKAESLRFVWIFLLVFGLFMIILGFLGVWGAVQSNKAFLLIYCVILFVASVSQIAGFTSMLVNQQKFEQVIKKWITDGVRGVKQDEVKSVTFMNGIQAAFHCCACEKSSDYSKDAIPDSCLNPYYLKEIKGKQNLNYKDRHFTAGCCKEIPLTLKKNLPYLSSIYYVLLTFEIVCLIVAVRTLTLIPEEEEFEDDDV